jgi:hypothetical protein
VTRFTSVALLGLFALLATEPAYAQQGSRRVGIGAALGDVSDVLLQLEVDQVTAPVILIPIQVTDGFRLEPEIDFFRSSVKELGPGASDDEASVNSVNGVEVGIGVFPQTRQENFRLYYGVRVGYTKVVQEDPLFRDTRTLTLDGFFVSPAVGGEYLFSDRFSLGAEVQLRHTSVKGDNVVEGITLPDGSPASDTIERSTTATRVLFISRFYF